MSHVKDGPELSEAETLVEITLVAARHYNDLHEALKDGREVTGRLINWAMEFENINRHRQWDGEWLDEVQDFAYRKIKELVAG